MRTHLGIAVAVLSAGLGCSLLVGAGCPAAPTEHFIQLDLVSNGLGTATNTDPDLVNPWGIAQLPTGPFWIASNGTGQARVYNGSGQPFPVGSPLVVTIPAPMGSMSPSTPTGAVANTFASMSYFGASEFIFVTEDGQVTTWQSANGTIGVIVVSNSGLNPRPVYKGVTLISSNPVPLLLVANFRDAQIDVFDSSFSQFMVPVGVWQDSTIPAGFAPFNVQTLNGKVYVTYAKQDADKKDDVPGAGNGFVSEFDTDGNFLRRIASGGALNSPWGLAIGPSSWGKFAGALLVGNFGDGKIHAFSLGGTPGLLGTVMDGAGKPIVNPGLWALAAGTGGEGSDPELIYFTAGGANEDKGLFGALLSSNHLQ
jgi:uncharacterized protein (TIGR03118 family)